MKLSSAVYEAIKLAIRHEAGGSVPPEARFDLAHDLAVRMLKSKEPENLPAWILSAARNSVADWLREERVHRELLRQLHEGRRVRGRTRESIALDWRVSYMTVKPTFRGSGVNDVEDAVIAAIDARTRKGKGPKRTPTCAQDLRAWEHKKRKKF